MIRSAALAVFGLASLGAMAQSRQLVPTDYEAGHFYAVPQTSSGKALRLMVDTGGGGGSGLFVIDPLAATRVGLKVTSCDLGGQTSSVIAPIAFRPGKALPPSLNTPCHSAALVVPGTSNSLNGDGLLGAGYLPGRIWTFDYPKHQLWVEPAGWQPAASMRRTPLGFLINSQGGLGSGFARISIKVAGEPLDLLLDTGASAKPTAAGKQAAGTRTRRGFGVTSYITTGTLEHSHRQHPYWCVVTDGDDFVGQARLIQVPAMAGWRLGPVWFTERPDANFSEEGNFRFMDGPIVGALGANVFQHFVMTIDYPERTAWFGCVEGCKAVKNP